VFPYLWSDSELTDCINDTIVDASIRAGLSVQDSVLIPFSQNIDLSWAAKYALPNRAISVKSVFLISQPAYPLTRTSFSSIERNTNSIPTQFGFPYAYALDQTKSGTGDYAGTYVRAITFIGTPSEADTASLTIIRLPNVLESSDDIPEIDELFQPDLIYGVTGLAYLKRDTDTFDPQRSQRDLQIFSDRFGERLSAVVIRERQTDVPMEMILY
jgi:hypothetical protein